MDLEAIESRENVQLNSAKNYIPPLLIEKIAWLPGFPPSESILGANENQVYTGGSGNQNIWELKLSIPYNVRVL